jgi:hypothetical protein
VKSPANVTYPVFPEVFPDLPLFVAVTSRYSSYPVFPDLPLFVADTSRWLALGALNALGCFPTPCPGIVVMRLTLRYKISEMIRHHIHMKMTFKIHRAMNVNLVILECLAAFMIQILISGIVSVNILCHRIPCWAAHRAGCAPCPPLQSIPPPTDLARSGFEGRRPVLLGMLQKARCVARQRPRTCYLYKTCGDELPCCYCWTDVVLIFKGRMQ